MKELTIKRLINTGNYENVEFTATFERITEKIFKIGPAFRSELTEELRERAFEEMDLIIKRAGLNDLIEWVKPIGQRDPVTKEDVDDLMDLADKIDDALEENDK